MFEPSYDDHIDDLIDAMIAAAVETDIWAVLDITCVDLIHDIYVRTIMENDDRAGHLILA